MQYFFTNSVSLMIKEIIYDRKMSQIIKNKIKTIERQTTRRMGRYFMLYLYLNMAI